MRERAQNSREKERVIQAFKWVKDHGISVVKASSKKRIRIKTSKQEEEGSPRQGAPYFTRLVGKSSRNSKALESGCYCTKFTCICFLCCTFCFEAFYIYLLQTGFPHGEQGFSRVMLTKNLCVKFMHA